MTSASEPIILSSNIVADLPLYYRAMAHHLANTGRIVIKDPLELKENAPPGG